MTVNDRIGKLQQALEARGIRITSQRALLLTLIEQANAPLDARTLLAQGRQLIPDLDKTTVYRTINLLKEHNLVDELDLLHHHGSGHFYEPVPERQEVHLVCLRCGRILESDSAFWEQMQEELEKRHHFRIATARVEIGGYCDACQEQVRAAI